MPSFSISLRPSTSTFSSIVRASSSACSASWVGVQWLPGRLAHLARQRDAGHDGGAALEAVGHHGLVGACAQQRGAGQLAAVPGARLGVAVQVDGVAARGGQRLGMRFGEGAGSRQPDRQLLAPESLELCQAER